VRRAALLLAGLPLLLAAGRAEARGCHESSEIVGKQHCSRFGGHWDVSSSRGWVFSIGPTVSHFPTPTTHFLATAGGHSFDVDGKSLGSFTGGGFALRLAMFPTRVLYVGVEAHAGLGSLPEVHLTPPVGPGGAPFPALAIHSTEFVTRSLGSVVGASVPVGPVDFSLEVFSGYRIVSPEFDWDHPAAAIHAAGGCTQGSRGGSLCPGVDVDSPFVARVEPRGGLAVRLSPWFTLRGLVGVDPLAHAAVTGALLLEAHTRSYDGFYPRVRAAPP
jgi:hypothetical protein